MVESCPTDNTSPWVRVTEGDTANQAILDASGQTYVQYNTPV